MYIYLHYLKENELDVVLESTLSACSDLYTMLNHRDVSRTVGQVYINLSSLIQVLTTGIYILVKWALNTKDSK